MEREERNKAERERIEKKLAEEERQHNALRINFKEADYSDLAEIDELDAGGILLQREKEPAPVKKVIVNSKNERVAPLVAAINDKV